MGIDDGSIDEIRTSLQHACPDRLVAVENVLSNGREMDAICAMSPSDRDESQQQLAEAMGC